MDILYIVVLAILIGGADSIEDKPDTQQRILLRKLQNFQETKPPTWNEVLADVLVNKIRIFSFTSQDKEDVIKDAPVAREKTILTDICSKVLLVYKKFIYDTFVVKRKESHELAHVTALPEFTDPKIDPEEIIKPTEVVYAKGPKSEVELVEPKYHGKITLEETTINPSEDASNSTEKANSTSNNDSINPEVQIHTDSTVKTDATPNVQGSVDSGLEESVVCAQGFVRNENGECVKIVSKLILAVPNQCPIGYRKDWLGYCRKIFRF